MLNEENKGFYRAIKAKANFQITLSTNPTNLRQAKSKNIGLLFAKGEFIKFLDADDILDKHHLRNQYNYFQESTENYCAVFPPTKHLWSVNGECKEQINLSYRTLVNSNFEQLKRFLVFPVISHCGCLFKKKDLISINGFDEELITDEDGDLILRLMLQGMLFIPNEDSFYIYRHHSYPSVSINNSEEKWQHRLRVCNKIEPLLKNILRGLKSNLHNV